MLLIGDSNDPSGNGMFSRSGRKLNKFFINLNKPSNLVPKLYFNEMKPPKATSNAFKIRHQSVAVARPSKVVTKVEPFALTKGREYYQNIDEKLKEAPTFGNYDPKPVVPKIKILRNYNYEKCWENDKRSFKENNQLLKTAKEGRSMSSDERLRYTCSRFKNHEGVLASSGFQTQQRFYKLQGLVEFDKQFKGGNLTEKSPFEFNLDAESSFRQTQVSFAPGHIDFRRTLPRNMNLERKKFQRNNYALNIKHDLVEKKLCVNIPDFNRNISRRSLSCKPACLNKGFYDGERVRLNTKTPMFGKMKARPDQLFAI
jgi:hypothetical protein